MDGFDYMGNDLNNCGTMTESAKECQTSCQNTEGCVQFTWIGLHSDLTGREKQCCLKNAVNNNPASHAGLISGPKFCGKLLFKKI